MEKNKINIPDLIERIDALNAQGREGEAQSLLEHSLDLARSRGDWSGELTVLSELLGQYRRSGQREKGLNAAEDARRLTAEHALEETVSGATVLINAATTLKCFGQAERSMALFAAAQRVYCARLHPDDYRQAGLYNNMALSCADLGRVEESEGHFKRALDILSRCPGAENDRAVTLCGLAELYYGADPLDERVNECMERAWELLNTSTLPRDGYHAFTLGKCAPCFERFGYFLYAAQLRKRSEEIYGRT